MSKRVVVVLGMHRSGTSALARGLRCLGLDLGADLIPGGPGNPTGYWEDRAVTDLDERVLEALGVAWDAPVLVGPPASGEVREQLAALQREARELVAARLDAHPRWGVKDPRMCRLLFFWREVFAALEVAPDFVVAVRDPRQVAASLRRRDGLPEDHSLVLWLTHVLPALAATAGTRRVIVDFELLLLDPAAQLERVARALDLTVNRDDSSDGLAAYERDFLKGGRERGPAEPAGAPSDADVPRLVEEAWELVRAAARDEIDAQGEKFARRASALVERLEEQAPLLRRLVEAERALAEGEAERRHGVDALFRRIGERTLALEAAQRSAGELRERLDGLTLTSARLADALAESEAALRDRDRFTETLARALQEALEVRPAALREQLELVLASRSWKITAPLRAAWGLAGRAARSRPGRRLSALAAHAEARRRGLFDAAYYRSQYPDLTLFRAFPFLHWLVRGADEGRNPGPAFDVAWYRQRYPDVDAAAVHPLVHYVRHGAAEGRDTCEPPAGTPEPEPPGPGHWAGRGSAPLALIVDSRWPRPDRDAGSVETDNLVEALLAFGYRVVFAPGSEEPGDAPYRAALEGRGVRCLPPLLERPLTDFLEAEGDDLDLCVLYRVWCGGIQFEAVHRLAARARVIFNTVDLHFVREEREARLERDPQALNLAAGTRERELYLVRNADATVVVSEHERAELARLVPGARVTLLPLARPARPPVAGFAARRGLGFVGGFAHAPNVDAVRHFLAEIWPLVLRRVPECDFTIVGEGLPAELRDALPPRVRYLGHVPDLAPWFEGLRLSVAPLRFGAGAKGKVVSSLTHGVPCVTTTVGAEGLGLEAGSQVLVADDAAAFAARVVEAYADRALWERLSRRGLELAARAWSVDSWRGRLAALLASVDLPAKVAP